MTVLGADDRVRVTDTTPFPFSAIVKVRVDFDGDGQYEGWGTGAMIGSNDVLTAGHVLWDRNHGYAKNIQVIPALNGESLPYGTFQGASWTVAPQYVSTGGAIGFDFGVINLSSAVGDVTGAFGLQASTSTSLAGTVATTAGFPGDVSTNGTVMMTGSGSLSHYGNVSVRYTIDTYAGQSGSPLWVTSDGSLKIVGIHTLGESLWNSGIVITQDYAGQISTWSNDSIDLRAVFPVSGTSAAEAITGSAAGDTIFGFSGDDTIVGGSGSDFVYGNLGADLLSGGAGADTMFGGQNQGPAAEDGRYRSGTETLIGGDGADLLYGNLGSDHLYGDAGADVLYGGQDADVLYGGDGADRLFGNLGDDLLYGDGPVSSSGDGADTIDGGAGIDTAVYLNAAASYEFVRLPDGAVQIGGADLLYGVEYVRFADSTLVVDTLI